MQYYQISPIESLIDLKPDIIILSVQKPSFVIEELREYLIQNNLTKIIIKESL